MNVKKLETERNYDDGFDRDWYHVSGHDHGTELDLNGEYGVINGAVVHEDGSDVEGWELIAVKRSLGM